MFRPVPKPNHNRRVNKSRKQFSDKVIKEILERDEHKCVRCGSHELDIRPHHVIFRSQQGLGVKGNGVSICRTCHNLAHKRDDVRRWFEEWVDKHLDEEGNLK